MKQVSHIKLSNNRFSKDTHLLNLKIIYFLLVFRISLNFPESPIGVGSSGIECLDIIMIHCNKIYIIFIPVSEQSISYDVYNIE